MQNRTIFDDIVDGTMPSWKVWEDDNYLAFLTPFANMPGATVVIPKKNPGDYIFDLDSAARSGLVDAAAKVAKLLELAFDAPKVAMVFEGEAVPYVHAKLYPMQAVTEDKLANRASRQEVYPEYPGFISTIDGPRMSDEQLNEIQQKIRQAAE